MDSEVKSVLMNEVLFGSLKEVKDAFYACGFDLDDSYFDYELLKLALRRKHVDISMFLLRVGCRVKNPNKSDFEDTPLHLAVMINSEYETENSETDQTVDVLMHDIIDALLDKGASIYDKDSNGDTPLFAAYTNGGDRKCYESIWITFNIIRRFNFNPENSDDVFHFHLACAINHRFIIGRFLKCGFDPNKPIHLKSEKYDGMNPIQLAIRRNMFEIFKLYLPYADLTIRNEKGLTYLHQIYFSGNSYPKSNRAWIKLAFRRAPHKNVNFEDKHGLSHFHLCCMINEPKILELYIACDGVNVNNAVSMDSAINPGYTPLHFAVESDFENVIDVLLKNGADPNKADKWGTTPLHLACKKSKNFKIKMLLLQYNASPVSVDARGYTPLHVLVYNAKRDGILTFDNAMSKTQWGSANYQDVAGVSLFHVSCMTNNVDRVKDYLDSGVDIDTKVITGKYGGFTALHFAVMYNQRDTVEFLLKRNAKVNVKTDASGYTPLHLACEYIHYMILDEEKLMYERRSDQLSIIELLLAHGALVDAKDSSGLTPLLRTCMIFKNGRRLSYSSKKDRDELRSETAITLTETIKILLSSKANINARTSNQSSILHVISQCKSLMMPDKLVEFLLLSGAKINALDGAGFTPLHVAVQCANKGVVRSLLKHNANPNIQSKKSRTPLHVVGKQIVRNIYLNSSVAILLKLLEYGADVNVNDTYTSSLLDYEDDEREELSYGALLKIVCIQVKKLSALKLPVSETLVHKCTRLHRLYEYEYEEYFNTQALKDNVHAKELRRMFFDCRTELDRMKKVKLDTYTTLFDILLKHPHQMATHVKNSSLRRIFQNDIQDYPLYGYLLRLQFKRGMLRRHVLQSAKPALKSALNTELPDLCINYILKYLENEDITNLKEAVSPSIKGNLKRKFGDDYTSEVESASKFKKYTFSRSKSNNFPHRNWAWFNYRHKKLRNKYRESSDNDGQL